MNIWDWKWRVFFDYNIKKEVEEWIEKLDKKEKEVYRGILDFYLSFYSFGILFDLIVENPRKINDLIETAEKSIEKIILLPTVLTHFYKRKVKELICGDDEKTRILKILKAAENAKDIGKEYWSLVSMVIGRSFESIVSEFNMSKIYSETRQVPRQKVIKSEVMSTFDCMYDKITKSQFLIKDFGPSAMGNFGKTIIDGNGYGEWWDREISDTGFDELILYTNGSRVKRDDYFYTIIHETYPGHGHFYNSIRENNNLIDHGATMMIEGWATYCEWNTFPSEYIQAIKHNAMVFLNNSYNIPAQHRARLIYDRKRKQGKKVNQFISTIINSTQYIGYIESYYLGALWLEKAINEKYKKPITYLKKLSKCNKGEFFSLWL